MDWQALVVVGSVVGLGMVALLLIWSRRRRHVARDTDPMFWMGLTIVGAGVAMIATAGSVAIGLIALGGALMFLGALRGSRSRRG